MTARRAEVLVVVPVLNEAAHIERLIEGLLPFARRTHALIIVADGGSTDGTQGIVGRLAQDNPDLRLIDNPARLQSAAVNLAVRLYRDTAEWMLRIDAHSAYPDDYGDRLLEDADRSGADSVVVSMNAVGVAPLQRLIALAQNAPLGNGGSAHRNRAHGKWVDHGHHALMRISAFRAVGGYDECFSHNEDAELDHRLKAAGFRIWLTAETGLDYYPRPTVAAVLLQYFRFGTGRAKNLIKHRVGPAPRQAIVAALAPAVLLAPLALLHVAFALPALLWLLACLLGGLSLAIKCRKPLAIVSGFIAGGMHLAWSIGFWAHTIPSIVRQGRTA